MAEETNVTTTNTSQSAQNASQETQTNSTATNSTTETNVAQKNSENNETNIEELVQKAVDRATNKLGNENKKLRESLSKLQEEHMTAEQRKELELQQKEADIADREAKLQEKINREFAMKAIKEAGLDDGGSNSLALIDFVVCNKEQDTLDRVKVFGELVDNFVKAEVDKTFKAHGRNPNGTIDGNSSTGEQSVPELLGKLRADQQKESNDILNHYLGGK